MSKSLFAFSGEMFVGKDFTANAAGLKVLGFADPIYQLTKYLTGTDDKSAPGVRQMMQQIGQWGWGAETEKYPYSAERAAITHLIRTQGVTMAPDFSFVDFSQYGRRKDFWVNILLTRLGLAGSGIAKTVDCASGETYTLHRKTPSFIGVTNVRFDHEMNPMKNAGFEHWHVRCSEETRLRRMLDKGYIPKDKEKYDASEELAVRLNAEMPDHRVIWNDTVPIPAGKKYVLVEEFVQMVEAAARFERGAVVTDNLMPERSFNVTDEMLGRAYETVRAAGSAVSP